MKCFLLLSLGMVGCSHTPLPSTSQLDRAMSLGLENLGAIHNPGAGIRGLVALALDPTQDKPSAETNRGLLKTAVKNLQTDYARAKKPDGRGFTWEDRVDPFQVYALVKYYEATGDSDVLKLAVALQAEAFPKRFPREPSSALLDSFTHLYEPVAEMAAYSRLAFLTKRAGDLDNVRSRYHAMREAGMISPTGWVAERADRKSDVGETNNTGELIETLMTFADAGWPEYYGDAERFLRGYLLPAQFTDGDLVDPAGNSDDDAAQRIGARVRGAFGFAAPYGLVATQVPYQSGALPFDGTTGVVASLAEVKKHVVTRRGDTPYLNFLLDYSDDRLKFRGPYANPAQRIEIETQLGGSVCVRTPPSADRERFHHAAQTENLTVKWQPPYTCLEGLVAERRYTLEFPLREMRETFTLNGRPIRVLWRGDEVQKMDSMGTPYPFFPPFPNDHRLP